LPVIRDSRSGDPDINRQSNRKLDAGSMSLAAQKE
jgi:hypothetical protein